MSTFAEDLASEKYCFNTTERRIKAQKQFEAISVPSDRVTPQDTCLVISMRPHRRELIQRFIQSADQDSVIAFSSAEVRREACQLSVEKIKTKNQKKTDVQASATGAAVETTEKVAAGTDTFEITTMSDFELAVDQDEVKGVCKYITPGRYEISLSIEKTLKPLHPAVAPGSMVIITTPPPDQETSILKTTIQLTRGQRIELGSVIKDLKNKNHGISNEPKLDVSHSDGMQEEQTFLSIK